MAFNNTSKAVRPSGEMGLKCEPELGEMYLLNKGMIYIFIPCNSPVLVPLSSHTLYPIKSTATPLFPVRFQCISGLQ